MKSKMQMSSLDEKSISGHPVYQYEGSLPDLLAAHHECSFSELAELSKNHLVHLCYQQQKAHRHLKQANDLLLDKLEKNRGHRNSGTETELLAAQCLIRDLERRLQSRGTDIAILREKNALISENLLITQQLDSLRSRETSWLLQLHELKEHSELLEFRVLELEGCDRKEDYPADEVIESENLESKSYQSSQTSHDDCTEDTISEDKQTSGHFSGHDVWQQERAQCQEKIALLQSSILELESALSSANERVRRCTRGDAGPGSGEDAERSAIASDDSHRKPSGEIGGRMNSPRSCDQRQRLRLEVCASEDFGVDRTAGGQCEVSSRIRCEEGGNSEAVCSPSPSCHDSCYSLSPSSDPQLRSSDCTCCLQHSVSDSELSDYHSDTTDSRTPQPSDLLPDPPKDQTPCSQQQPGGYRRRRSCSSCQRAPSPLQESGIFDVEFDDKAVQTDVSPSSASMREFTDLNSEIARLTSVQKQLQLQQQNQQQSESLEKSSGNDVLLPELCSGVDVSSQSSSKRSDSTFSTFGGDMTCNSVSVQTEYCHDQLLCDYENLLKRFQKNKKTLNRIEEEKNELEEAENDARLMVQRLEMKIFASNEVEKMLSSDLADEQERSQNLQRQLNSLKLKRQAEIKALHSDQDRLQLIQRVKHQENLVCILKDKLKKASKFIDSMDDKTVDANVWIHWRENSCSDSATSLSENSDSASPLQSPQNYPSTNNITKVSMESQTCLSVQMNQSCRISERRYESSESGRTVECSRPAKRPRSADSDSSDITDSEFSGQKSGVRCEECNRHLSSSSSSSSTDEKRNSEQRETYYTDCIHKLQLEKASCRKQWEKEKAGFLQTIEDASREQSSYKQKLETALTDCENIRKTLSEKINELNDHLRERTQSFDELHQKTVNDSALQLETLSEQGAHLKRRVVFMEQLLNTMAGELTSNSRVSVSNNLEEFSTEVLESARSLKERNRRMAAEVTELLRKEAAYRETMEKADSIMREVEARYQQTISDMERRLLNSGEAIAFLEKRAVDLQSRTDFTDSGEEQQRSSDMLVRLVETEKRVHFLEGELHEMEKREREMSVRLRQEELNSTSLQHQLQENDEVVKELQIARRDLSECSEQMKRLDSLRHRLAELQQSNDFMHGRVEELEQNELHLQSTIRDMKSAHDARERSDQEKICRLQTEVDGLQLNYQTSQLQLSDNEDKLERLEKQLLDVQKKLSVARDDVNNVKNCSSQAELQLRQEITKLRSQLNVANQQLIDGEASSSQNREKISQLENDNSRLMTELRSQTSVAEQDVVKLNLEIGRYEEQISALSEQLNTLQPRVEFDTLSERETLSHRLYALIQDVQQQITTCESCHSRVEASLTSITSNLEQSKFLLAGSLQDQSLHVQLIDALDRENSGSSESRVHSSGSSGQHGEMTCSAPCSRLHNADAPPLLSVKDVEHAGVQTDANSNSTCTSCQSRLEMQQRLDRISNQLEGKERELQLVDEQSSQLQGQLESRDQQLAHLRKRLLSSSEQMQLHRNQQRQLAEQLRQVEETSRQMTAQATARHTLLSTMLKHLPRVLHGQQAEQLTGLLRQPQEAANVQEQQQELDLNAFCHRLAAYSLTRTSSMDNASTSSASVSCENSARSRIPRPIIRAVSVCSLTDTKTVPNTNRRRNDSLPSPARFFSNVRPVPLVGVAHPYRSDPSQSAIRSTAVVKSTLPLPSPDNFQIIKKIGSDSLLVYWSATSDSRISGYEIFVDNKLSQVIRNAGRTKALLPSLRLTHSLQLAIRSVSASTSRVSALAWAEYKPRQ